MSTGVVLAQAGPAAADTQLCDQYASTTIGGGAYIVQNNRWGTTGTQCINVTSTGFQVTQQDGVAATNGAPTAYPSVVWGCHYGACTPGFSPIPYSQISGINTSVSMSYPSGGNWDAAYDIWLDPTPRTTGQNTGAEIMVWLNHSGPPQPVGQKVGTANIAGGTWDVWEGNTGWNVISYVRTSATGSISFPVSTFTEDAANRGYVSRSWYLTSIQAGFEPWSNGKGLAVNSFSVTRGNTPPATSVPPTTNRPTTPPVTTRPTTPTTAPTTPPASGSGGCKATISVGSQWNTGFTENVTVTAGNSAIKGWTVSWTWPNGQKLTSGWNATFGGSGSSVTATSMNYNGALGANASSSFGFQGTGTAATPTATCTAS